METNKTPSRSRPLRLAYFSPLPPARTGIADYSRELLPALNEQAQVTVFAADPAQVDETIAAHYDLQPANAFPEQRWRFDMPIYQMGNSGGYHDTIYEMAIRYPGVVVLHDHILHHFIAYATIGANDHALYARELGYALGNEGYDLAWSIRLGFADKPEYELPLNNRLIDRSLGLIVHSQDTAEKIRRWRTDRPVQVAPQHSPLLQGKSQRPTLGLADETVIFGSTGLVNETKRLDVALATFSQLRQSDPDVFYLVVGGVHNDVNLDQLVRQNNLQKAFYHTGFVDGLGSFGDWTATADVIVNLRYPTLGETSATALRAMAAGRPLIVFDHGWYSEIPDDACLKVPPMDEEALLAAMRRLARDRALRQEMGQAARHAIEEQHQPAHTASCYLALIDQVLDGLAEKYR